MPESDMNTAPRSKNAINIGEHLDSQKEGLAIGAKLAGLAPGERTRVGHPEVDICFVFDTTGSMSNKIDGLIASMSSFIDELVRMDLDWRTTVVPFGDLTVQGDRVDAQLPFVANAEASKAQLRSLPRFSGGSNEGESAIEAMMAGLGKPWRQGAVRILILLTDEPALAHHGAGKVDTELSSHDVICFVASVPEQYFITWATNHGGQWLEIAPTMNTASIVSILRSLLPRVVKVAYDVHALAGGSVSKYLQLPPSAR